MRKLGCVQWNAGRCMDGGGREELLMEMTSAGAGVAFLQEPGGEDMKWNSRWREFRCGRAVMLCEKRLLPRRVGQSSSETGDWMAIEIDIPGTDEHLTMVSVYIPPGEQAEKLNLIEDLLTGELVEGRGDLVVGGDFNVHARSLGNDNWGHSVNRMRFDSIIEIMRTNGGQLVNTSGTVTRIGYVNTPMSHRTSTIDATCVVCRTGKVLANNWRVGEAAASDHKLIFFDIEMRGGAQIDRCEVEARKRGKEGFKFNRKGWLQDPETRERFQEMLEQRLLSWKVEVSPQNIENAVRRFEGLIRDTAIRLNLVKRGRGEQQKRPGKAFAWNKACSQIKLERDQTRRELATQLGLKRIWEREVSQYEKVERVKRTIYELKSKWRRLNEDLKKELEGSRKKSWQEACGLLKTSGKWEDMFSKAKVLNGDVANRGVQPFQNQQGEWVAGPGAQAEALSEFWRHRASENHPDSRAFDQKWKEEVEMKIGRKSFWEDKDDMPDLCTAPFRMEELNWALGAIRSASAPAKDGISNALLKAMGTRARELTLALMNLAWECETFCDDWKLGEISPIPKTQEITQMKDWRPITILPCMGKLMERLIQRRMEFYVETSGALRNDDIQLGFRKGCSAPQQVLRVTQMAHEAWHEDKDLAMVLLDVARAYDTVWRDGLMVKLDGIGINGKLLRWLRSCIEGRKVCVKVDGHCSRGVKWDLGLQQGAILSPLLFRLYYSDLHGKCSHTDQAKYADDAGVMMRISRARGWRSRNLKSMSEDLESMLIWARKWRMAMEPSKTKLMIFRPYRLRKLEAKPGKVKMGGVDVIETRDPTRYLGVLMDRCLTFEAQTKMNTERARRRVNFMSRVAGREWGAERRALRLLYEHWVRPIMEYGYEVFAARGVKQLRKMHSVQNKAVRTILGCNNAASAHGTHAEAGVEFLGQRWARLLAMQASRLSRLEGSNAAANLWIRWLGNTKPIEKMREASPKVGWSWNPHIGFEREPGKGARSRWCPFQVLEGCLSLFSLHQDEPKEDLDPRGKGNGPQSRDPATAPGYTPRSMADILETRRPVFGAASTRRLAKAAEARSWANNLILMTQRKATEEGKHCIMLYTDGSFEKRKPGGGAGVYVTACMMGSNSMQELRMAKVCLGNIASSYMAEMVGVLEAARMIPHIVEEKGWDCKDTRVALWTDSNSVECVMRAGGPRRGGHWSTAEETMGFLENMAKKGCEVSLDWIPGHAGVPGNERADRLADEAAKASRAPGAQTCSARLPVSLIRNHVKNLSNKARWLTLDNSELARIPCEARKAAGGWRKIDGLLVLAGVGRREEVAISRLRAGCEVKPGDRLRTKVWESTECPDCGDLFADGAHRMWRCPRWREERQMSKKTLRNRFAFSWEQMICLKGVPGACRVDVIKELADFLKRTGMAGELSEVNKWAGKAGVLARWSGTESSG